MISENQSHEIDCSATQPNRLNDESEFVTIGARSVFGDRPPRMCFAAASTAYPWVARQIIRERRAALNKSQQNNIVLKTK